MSYVPESDICVKSYDHLNFSRAFVVQFRASRYIMSLNRTSEWNVMTIRICWELPLFNFERLDILCPRIGHPSENLWPFKFLKSLGCSFSSVSLYHGPHTYTRVKSYGCLNLQRAYVLSFERHDILWAWIRHPSENLWPFEFLESFCCSFFRVSIYHGHHTST